MTKERSLLIYIVDILTRKCELVRLPLEDNEFFYWPYVLGCWSFRDLPFRDPYTFAT